MKTNITNEQIARDVTSILLNKEFSKSSTPYLAEVVTKYLNTYQEVLREVNLKNI